jgi:glycosyltransferase involved in cell wall biosynthesis
MDRLYRELLPRRRPGTMGPALPRVLRGPIAEKPSERPLRILLFSQYFPPEVGATQTRMQAFAEYLAARGHSVTVVCEFPNHPQGVMPPAYSGRLVEDDRSNAYRVIRVWVKTSEEKTQRTRLSFYVSYMALAAAVAPLAGRPDVVLGTSPPLFAGLAGLASARFHRVPFVLDVRDLWPAAATSLHQISPGAVTRVGLALERLLYGSAAEVVAVTRPFCEHIDAIRGPERSPAWLIPNGTLDVFFEEPASRDRLGVPNDRLLVTFAGTLGIAQALPAVLDAAERLNGTAHLAFVGEGPMKDIVSSDAARRRLDNVSFHPQLPLERIMSVLAASDALLVSLSAHPVFEAFVPSKMIDFMAAGRPVVLSAAGESARILDEAGGGLVVAPEDPEALAEAIRWLAAHRGEGEEMGRRGREYAQAHGRGAHARELEELLVRAAARRKP